MRSALPILLYLSIPATVLISFLVNRWWDRRFPARTFRKRQRRVRLALLAMVVCAGLPLVRFLRDDQWMSKRGMTSIALAALMVAGLLPAAFRKQSEDEAVADHAQSERTLCGRCEYDLAGNTSGVCPECGWRIPQEVDLDDADWMLWWRRWRIGRLKDWRAATVGMGCLAVWIMGLSIVTFVWGPWLLGAAAAAHSPTARALLIWGPRLAAAAAGLLGLHMAINALRAYQYGRREKVRTSGDEERSGACKQEAE